MDHARCTCTVITGGRRVPNKDCAYHGAPRKDPIIAWSLSERDKSFLRSLGVTVEEP